MKRIVLLTMLICSGCATVTIDTKREDGKLVGCHATAYSLFLSLNEVGLSACGGKTAAQGVKGDADSMRAFAETVGIATGTALKAVVPIP